MQLKEFALISPVIESTAVLKAIETVISPDAIAETLGNTNSFESRQRQLPSQLVVCLGKSDESMVFRCNGNCTQKPGQWFE